MPRGFDAFQLVTLACLGVMGLGRAVQLRGRGVNVLPPTEGRPLGQVALEKAFALCLLLWVYEVVAEAWPLQFRMFPPPWDPLVVDAPVARGLGAALSLAALAIYALGLLALGASWRLGIDPRAPGPLVCTGIFAWSRNPIYVALNLYAAGTFLMTGRLFFLLSAVGLVGYLHFQIRQEETFLARTFGGTYRAYRACVGRYFTGRRRDAKHGTTR